MDDEFKARLWAMAITLIGSSLYLWLSSLGHWLLHAARVPHPF